MKTRIFLGITTIAILATEPFIFYQLGLKRGASNAQHDRVGASQNTATDAPVQRIEPAPAMEFVDPPGKDGPQQQPELAPTVSTIGEALAIEDPKLRKKAMVALVQLLIEEDPLMDDTLRKSLLRQLNRANTHGSPGEEMENNFGLESSLAAIVVQLSNGPEIANAWRQAFADHPNRANIFSGLIDAVGLNNPGELLAQAEGWTDWEKRYFHDRVINSLKSKDPMTALNWLVAYPDDFSGGAATSVFKDLATLRPDQFDQALESLEDPLMRLDAIQGKAEAMAAWDTKSAMSWADSLESKEEQDTAHGAIYDATPRGIGAAISQQDGFVQVQTILPGSPLNVAGIQSGDRITSVQDAAGNEINLFGTDLGEAVKNLRGEPNTSLNIRVLRWNEQDRSMSEFSVDIDRRQMYMREGEMIGDFDYEPGG